MLSELQVKNIGETFKLIDANGNGTVEKADFAAMAEKVLGGLGLGDQSEHRGMVRDAFAAWWEEIRRRADVDENGRVNRAEFLAAAEKGMLSDQTYLDVLANLSDKVFDAVDRDGDGHVTREEFAGIYLSAGAEGSQANSSFGQVDADGDDRVARDEFRAMVKGAFTSTRPDTVGANIFGYVQDTA